MLDTRWEISDERYAMGLSAENADQLQGFHSPNMLIVVDEAEGVSDEIYEAIEAVMTATHPLLLLILSRNLKPSRSGRPATFWWSTTNKTCPPSW